MSEQSDTAGPIGKINSGADGLGNVTPEMVEERATQLAQMEGRTEANDRDRERALGESQGPEQVNGGPEVVSPELENVTDWNDSPVDHGRQAGRVLPEDEANIAETLVQEGIEEAEHDRRVSAVEEAPPGREDQDL